MVFSKIAAAVVVAVLCLFFGAYGQVKDSDNKGAAVDVTAGGLQVGDVVPDVLVSGVHNYNVGADGMGVGAGSFRLSDFRGKLLILDFWATWCVPCVAMMPRLDSLSRRFSDKVSIVSVGYQKDAEVLPFVERLEKDRALGRFLMPMVVGDTVLRKLFPHEVLPHYVWIGGDGKVLAITEASEVNERRISEVLGTINGGGADASLSRKRDMKISYDHKRPLFVEGNGGDGRGMLGRSILTGFQQGLGPAFRMDKLASGIKITGTNLTMLQLLRFGFGGIDREFGWNRVRVRGADSASLRPPVGVNGNAYLEWLAGGKGFCYELVSEAREYGAAFGLVRQDLQRYFPGYRVKVAEELTQCLVLKRTSARDRIASAGGKQVANFAKGCELRNVGLNALLLRLEIDQMQRSAVPIVDGTGYKGNVDMVLEADLSDLGSLNRALEKYDLKLEYGPFRTHLLVVERRR